MGEIFAIAAILLILSGGPEDAGDPPADDDDDDDDKPKEEPGTFVPGVVLPGINDPTPDPKPADVVPGFNLPGGPVGPGGEEPPKPGNDLPSVLDDYPTVSKLYQVVKGDTGALSSQSGGIAHRGVAQFAYSLAIKGGASASEASAYASAEAKKHRTAYWLAIEADYFNDRLYGTFGYGKNAMASPITKRAIRLLPQNADNVARIAQNAGPIRSVLLSTPGNAKQGTGIAAPGAPTGHYELLWLPPIHEAAFLSGSLVVDTSGPPQWLRNLGVVDRSGAPAGTNWGG